MMQKPDKYCDKSKKPQQSVRVGIAGWVFLGLIRFYQLALSPLLGANCRYQPTCSAYATQAITQYGAWYGGWLVVKRIGRCHPWGGFGYDPVPSRDKGTPKDM